MSGAFGGVAVEYPGNWELTPPERLDNMIILEAKKGLFQRGSARIEIMWGGLPTSKPVDLEMNLLEDLDRIRRLYDLDSVTITEPLDTIERESYGIATVAISIPTIEMSRGSSRNQMGAREPDVSQTIIISHLRNAEGDRYISAYVYKGTNKELNSQAEEIVDSIVAFVDSG